MKRTAIITMLLGLFIQVCLAQGSFKKSLSGITKIQLETGTSVIVKAGASNEMILSDNCKNCDENRNSQKKRTNDRAKGLKPIYNTGEDNTGYGFEVEQRGDVLYIKDLVGWMKRSGLKLTIPSNIDLALDCGNLGGAEITGLNSEIEVNTNVGHITINEVSGPITAHTSTGTIEVIFSEVNQSSPTSISSSTGIVDVSLPANTKANVELRSTMGSVFSNFDLVPPREDGLVVVGANRNIKGKLNNGGVSIRLKSSTGSIYLRKKE